MGDYIAEAASPALAGGYVSRVREACWQLRNFPERGSLWPDLGPGVRVVGFERRVSIVFQVGADEVLIVGIFYGGRDIAARFRPKDDPAG